MRVVLALLLMVSIIAEGFKLNRGAFKSIYIPMLGNCDLAFNLFRQWISQQTSTIINSGQILQLFPTWKSLIESLEISSTTSLSIRIERSSVSTFGNHDPFSIVLPMHERFLSTLRISANYNDSRCINPRIYDFDYGVARN